MGTMLSFIVNGAAGASRGTSALKSTTAGASPASPLLLALPLDPPPDPPFFEAIADQIGAEGDEPDHQHQRDEAAERGEFRRLLFHTLSSRIFAFNYQPPTTNSQGPYSDSNRTALRLDWSALELEVGSSSYRATSARSASRRGRGRCRRLGLHALAGEELGQRVLLERLALAFLLLDLGHVDHVLGDAGLAGRDLVALLEHAFDVLQRVAEIADLEGGVAEGRGRFGLRLLDLDLRQLLLEAAHLVLELALDDLGLPQVVLVGLLGLLQLLGVRRQVDLQLLQLARERAGELHVAGRVVGEDAALEVLGLGRLALT